MNGLSELLNATERSYHVHQIIEALDEENREISGSYTGGNKFESLNLIFTTKSDFNKNIMLKHMEMK